MIINVQRGVSDFKCILFSDRFGLMVGTQIHISGARWIPSSMQTGKKKKKKVVGLEFPLSQNSTHDFC